MTPLFLVIVWGIAAALNSHGFDRDMSQLFGIFTSGIAILPAYCALRPFLVNVEVENSPRET
jgi:hypothetical protein